MSLDQQHGLMQKYTLTLLELAAIKQLVATCEDYEQLHLRVTWGMLQSRSSQTVLDFLYYVHGELVGYLFLDNWGVKEKEAIVLVHPDYRRRGIARVLLAAAYVEARRQHVERFVLICEQKSHAGQAFIKAHGAIHVTSEYEMLLDHFQPRQVFDDRLSFRPADLDDLDTLVMVQVASFGDPEDVVRRRITKLLFYPTCHYYLATFGEPSVGCEEPIGSFRLDDGEDELGIYGFGILPDYWRRGYGRQMLEEAIRIVRTSSQKPIMLDVDTQNLKALNLYRSCGFQIRATYDYYNLAII